MAFTLSERDLEDYLFTHPGAIRTYFGSDISWIARQFRVPSGIIDLLGYTITNTGGRPWPVVVELKSVPISSAAITQVCRYSSDVYNAICLCDPELYCDFGERETVFKIVIGPGGSLSNELLYEANALNVSLFTFEPKFDLKIEGRWLFTKEKRDEDSRLISEISRSPAFSIFNPPPQENDLLKPFEDFLGSKEDGE